MSTLPSFWGQPRPEVLWSVPRRPLLGRGRCRDAGTPPWLLRCLWNSPKKKRTAKALMAVLPEACETLRTSEHLYIYIYTYIIYILYIYISISISRKSIFGLQQKAEIEREGMHQTYTKSDLFPASDLDSEISTTWSSTRKVRRKPRLKKHRRPRSPVRWV